MRCLASFGGEAPLDEDEQRVVKDALSERLFAAMDRHEQQLRQREHYFPDAAADANKSAEAFIRLQFKRMNARQVSVHRA